ncbi:MAG: NosD domain-containing protein, partial [Polyangiaceae bacterium]
FHDNEFSGNGARALWEGATVAAAVTPQAVTLSDPPVPTATGIVVVIQTGASSGPTGMTFEWSMDGGATWVATGVAGAATVPLTTSGVTANFPSGTYTTGDTYTATVPSAGTSPPPVWLSGTALSAVEDIRIKITTTGTVGGSPAMAFEWSMDLGLTWNGPYTATASYSLAGSGFTANFTNGVTYHDDDVYTGTFYSAVAGASIATTAGQPSSRLHCFRNTIFGQWDDYGIALYDTDYSEIVNNTIRLGRTNRGDPTNDHSGYGILCYRSFGVLTSDYNNRVEGNTISECAGIGIYMQGIANCVVANNVLNDTALDMPYDLLDPAAIMCNFGSGSIVGNIIGGSGRFGIAIEGPSYSVSGNVVSDCESAGIFLDSTAGNPTAYVTVSGNQVAYCSFGIYAPNGIAGCALTGNVLNSSANNPISLAAATDCSVIGNQIDTAGSEQYGIYLDSASARCIVSGNGLKNISSWAIASNAPSTQILHNVVYEVPMTPPVSSSGVVSSGDGCTIFGNDVSSVTGTPYAVSGTGSVLNGLTGRGLSSTATPSANLSGQATCTGGSGATFGYTLSTEEDTSYRLVLTPVGSTGTPAAWSNRAKSVSKTTTGGTVTLEADPGAGSSVTFDWHLLR